MSYFEYMHTIMSANTLVLHVAFLLIFYRITFPLFLKPYLSASETVIGACKAVISQTFALPLVVSSGCWIIICLGIMTTIVHCKKHCAILKKIEAEMLPIKEMQRRLDYYSGS